MLPGGAEGVGRTGLVTRATAVSHMAGSLQHQASKPPIQQLPFDADFDLDQVRLLQFVLEAMRRVTGNRPHGLRRFTTRLSDGRAIRPAVPRPLGSVAEAQFTEICTSCGDCALACPEAIIARDGAGYPVLDLTSGACTFCGACTEACETGALIAGQAWTWRARADDSCMSRRGIACRACEDHCDAQAIRFRLIPGRAR